MATAIRCRSRRRVIFDATPPDPLPLVLDEAPDESLSSWLIRHAQFYGIAPSTFSRRVGIDMLTLARIDRRLTAGAARALAIAMRRSRTEIASMTHQQHEDRLAPMIARGKAAQTCVECQLRHRSDKRVTVVLKSWSQGWRIACPVCGSRLQEVDGGEVRPPSDAFEHVWDEARNGEELLTNIERLAADRAAFVVALLHLLLLHRSPTRSDAPRQIARGRVLDVVVPGFDDFDRRARFTINGTTPLVVPLTIRIALLAGLSRTQNDPDFYKRMENACSGKESIRFDAVKIKLLADAHPTFSYLQQIRDSSPFWSRHFQQRRSKTAPVSPYRTV
ncbi:MAG: TniQ family protein [Roseiarcus sp.]